MIRRSRLKLKSLYSLFRWIIFFSLIVGLPLYVESKNALGLFGILSYVMIWMLLGISQFYSVCKKGFDFLFPENWGNE